MSFNRNVTPANFDPDLSPSSGTNRRAAEARGVTYDPRERVYRDRDGLPIYDEYGQPL